MIINIGSQIIIRDQEFSKSYQSKVLFLESKIADLSSLEKVNAEKSKLANTENRLEKLNKEVFDSSWYHKTLELIKDALIEKQYYQYSSRLAEKEIEEHELKSQLLEIERSKLNEILENLNSEKDKLNKKVNNVTEIITVIINSQYISQNNLAYLRDELAGLLNEPNKKIGINEESLLIAKSISK